MRSLARVLFPLLLVPAACHAPAPVRSTALSDATRARLASLVESTGASGISGAIVLPEGEVVAVAVGADGAGVRLTPASRFMSGSVGKTYCAAVALQLVDEGMLQLDGRVEEVLGRRPWYRRVPNGATITLRQLLNHTSGIREHVWKPEFQQAVMAAKDRALSPEECLQYALDDEPLFPAGERFAYADTNYLLVGLCIEAATGRPFFDVLRHRILDPLRLDETSPNDRRDLPGLACGVGSGLAFHEGPTVVDGLYFTNPAFEYCGGGVNSTARDLARWTMELFTGDVVPTTLHGEHRRAVAAPARVSGGYGLGCFVGESPHGPALGHSGVMPGFLSYTLYYPDLEVSVAVMLPTDDARRFGGLRWVCDDLATLARDYRLGRLR